jgi:hypothetical protein
MCTMVWFIASIVAMMVSHMQLRHGKCRKQITVSPAGGIRTGGMSRVRGDTRGRIGK